MTTTNPTPTQQGETCYICGGENGEHVYEMHREGFEAPPARVAVAGPRGDAEKETGFMVSEPSVIDCAVCGGRFPLPQTLIVKNAAGRPERACAGCSKGKPKVESEWPERLTIVRYNDGGFSATEAIPPDGARFTHVYHRDAATSSPAPAESEQFDLDPLEFWCDLAEVLGHPRPQKVNPASLVAEVNERLAAAESLLKLGDQEGRERAIKALRESRATTKEDR